MSQYLKNAYNLKETPQSQPIPGTNQVENSACGFAWAVDDWTRLKRFLILGADGGSYYASEQKLARENTGAVERCIMSDGLRVVQTIVEISEAGRAPKNDPALFALAMAASIGNEATKAAALAALSKVARIGTHLFHFASYLDGMRGWGRGVRRAVGNWYLKMPVDKLAYQIAKYQSRDDWSHSDLLRLAHPVASSKEQDAVFRWAKDGLAGLGERSVVRKGRVDGKDQTANYPDVSAHLPKILEGFEKAKFNPDNKAYLIHEYGLTREMVPTEWLNDVHVWEALLDNMPMTAMIRSLGKMGACGLLVPGAFDPIGKVVAALSDQDTLKKSRIHPIQVLSALMTYGQGHGVRGDNQWPVVPQVIDALDKAFYLSFGNVQSTGKRFLLALDVSGSMSSGEIAGVPGLTPRVGAAAMALITAATEPNYSVVAFTSGTRRSMWAGYGTGITSLSISPRQRLDDVVRLTTELPFGGTDCALPMIWAEENKIPIDVFVVLTDSETWAGNIHPSQALKKYRQAMGINSKLVVVGMVANEFSIADPKDSGMLDCVGFDTSTPEIMSMFARGEI